MANLKDIRNRIHSVSSTMQVTSAMKMVSAAKFKKAQNEVAKVRPFEAKLAQIIAFLGSSVPNVELNYPAFRAKTKGGKILLVAIASDKGLAGAFNSNVVKEVERLLSNDLKSEAEQGLVEVLTIGKQAAKGVKSRHVSVSARSVEGFYENFSLAKVYEVADELTKRFEAKEYSKVILIYNEFVNAAVQNVRGAQLLPLEIATGDENGSSALQDFIVEPSKEEVLADLIPQSIRTRFLSVIKESLASEHGARMTSMQKATDNASELLGELELQYNKARQTAITNELIEIVSGASALNG